MITSLAVKEWNSYFDTACDQQVLVNLELKLYHYVSLREQYIKFNAITIMIVILNTITL